MNMSIAGHRPPIKRFPIDNTRGMPPTGGMNPVCSSFFHQGQAWAAFILRLPSRNSNPCPFCVTFVQTRSIDKLNYMM